MAVGATIRLDSTRTYLKTGQLKVAPGDTVCLAPGRRLHQFLQGLRGTAERPIVVTNCPGGRVLVGTTHHFGIILDSVAHVRLTGGLDPQVPYGIHVDGTSAGSGVAVTGLSHHVEIERIEISGTNFAGIMVKQDYGGAPPEPLPLFPGLSIHHNHIHDVGGEGMYLGETKSPGMLFSGMEVHHNLVERAGWDGLQVSNTHGVRVHHNVVVRSGTKGELYQANGIQIGNNVRDLRLDHNIVLGSNENSLNHLGGGMATIDSNWFESPSGPQSLFIDDRSHADTGSTIAVRDNFWRHPTRLVWKNYTAVNPVTFSGNRQDPHDTLVVYASGAGPATTTFSANIVAPIAPIAFADSASDDWRIPSTNPWASWDLGFGSTTSASVVPHTPRVPAARQASRTVRLNTLPLPLPHPQGRSIP
jgi:hypothetical protein